MSELEDRPDAAPAIETPAAPLAPATGPDHEALLAIEGMDAPTPEGAPSDAGLLAEVDFATLPATGEPAPAPAPGTGDVEPDWAAGSLSDLAPGIDDDAPLLDDELESGIASVFAALHSATHGDTYDRGPGTQQGDAGEGDDTDAIDLTTFRLLGELDRLWHRAA